MKPIGTPAYRPTADSIWSSFLSSGKRHLILTGRSGCGKTTRIDQFRAQMPGIITYAVPRTGVYLQEHPCGSPVLIGVYDPALPGTENKMRICPDGFEAHAVPAVQKLAQGRESWVFVDEIGYLESDSAAYQNALRELFDRKCVIAAVRKQDTPFLQEICKRPDAFCMDLDAPFGHTGCVIMASGLSRRFGSNKLMADFHGAPMIQRILDATEGVFSRRALITRHSDVAKMAEARGLDVVLHALPERSDTIRLGLQAVGKVDGCLFCPGDQPLLQQKTVAALALCAAQDRNSIWRPCFGTEPGSPVLFPKWAFEQLMNLPAGKGGAFIARMYPERVRTFQVEHACELLDADTPEALERLLKLASELH